MGCCGMCMGSVKAGIEHLQDKLECVREEVGGQAIQMSDETVRYIHSRHLVL